MVAVLVLSEPSGSLILYVYRGLSHAVWGL
jgi:hypothetical protein